MKHPDSLNYFSSINLDHFCKYLFGVEREFIQRTGCVAHLETDEELREKARAEMNKYVLPV